jgi:hypothetical protein
MTLIRSAAALLLVIAVILAAAPHAHQAVTSKFTYNRDVFPVFDRRCSHCHVEGGVGPMSLMDYRDAFPWAESLRVELPSRTHRLGRRHHS